jgi:4'-phosphopantetheinyl transferase
VVHIFYHHNVQGSSSKTADKFLDSFPPGIQSQIVKYKNPADRNRAALGKALLVRALKILEIPESLDDIRYTRYRRPYFNDSFDFNISHKGDFVVCAISKTHRVGIDIEKVRPVVLDDFEHAFSEMDWSTILNSDASHQLQLFYSLWTKRESFLKAIGTGFHQSTNNIYIGSGTISWDKEQWFIQEIIIDKEYSCHLSVSQCLPRIQLQEIKFE